MRRRFTPTRCAKSSKRDIATVKQGYLRIQILINGLFRRHMRCIQRLCPEIHCLRRRIDWKNFRQSVQWVAELQTVWRNTAIDRVRQ